MKTMVNRKSVPGRAAIKDNVVMWVFGGLFVMMLSTSIVVSYRKGELGLQSIPLVGGHVESLRRRLRDNRDGTSGRANYHGTRDAFGQVTGEYTTTNERGETRHPGWLEDGGGSAGRLWGAIYSTNDYCATAANLCPDPRAYDFEQTRGCWRWEAETDVKGQICQPVANSVVSADDCRARVVGACDVDVTSQAVDVGCVAVDVTSQGDCLVKNGNARWRGKNGWTPTKAFASLLKRQDGFKDVDQNDPAQLDPAKMLNQMSGAAPCGVSPGLTMGGEFGRMSALYPKGENLNDFANLEDGKLMSGRKHQFMQARICVCPQKIEFETDYPAGHPLAGEKIVGKTYDLKDDVTREIFYDATNKQWIYPGVTEPEVTGYAWTSTSTPMLYVDDVGDTGTMFESQRCWNVQQGWDQCCYSTHGKFGGPTHGSLSYYFPDPFNCPCDVTCNHGIQVLHILGFLYLAFGLAIVCDDYFVPALEVLIRRCKFTEDYAGATWMAAGGSMPELATGIMGAMFEDTVGFATIVGSAVFNILFVIGCCALFAHETLELTWWPLARDTTFYTISLALLAVFFITGGVSVKGAECLTGDVTEQFGCGTTAGCASFKTACEAGGGAWTAPNYRCTPSDLTRGGLFAQKPSPMGERAATFTGGYTNANRPPTTECAAVWVWEAAILLVFYVIYCVVVLYSTKIEKCVKGCLSKMTGKEFKLDDASAATDHSQEVEIVEIADPRTGPEDTGPASKNLNVEEPAQLKLQKAEQAVSGNRVKKLANKSGFKAVTFRAGISQLLTSDYSVMQLAANHLVFQIKGDLDDTWHHVDADKSGDISYEEMTDVLKQIGINDKMSDEERHEYFQEIDTDNNGRISKTEFTKWYLSNENKIHKEIIDLFDYLDADSSGCIDKLEIRKLLRTINDDNPPTDEEVQKYLEQLDKNKNGRVDRSEFIHWYENTYFFETDSGRQLMEAMSEEDLGVNLWNWPKGTGARIWTLVKFPIGLAFYCTIPDSRRKKLQDWWPVSFGMSIFWLMFLSYVLVGVVINLGVLWGLPSFFMGFSFLAISTSVPDLITSVLVARQGQGNMAVSSSLGSNIFDVLVGLPFPYFLYCFIYGPTEGAWYSIVVDTNVLIALVLLMTMLILVVICMIVLKWKLTKQMAGAMIALYIAFFMIQVFGMTDFGTTGC